MRYVNRVKLVPLFITIIFMSQAVHMLHSRFLLFPFPAKFEWIEVVFTFLDPSRFNSVVILCVVLLYDAGLAGRHLSLLFSPCLAWRVFQVSEGIRVRVRVDCIIVANTGFTRRLLRSMGSFWNGGSSGTNCDTSEEVGMRLVDPACRWRRWVVGILSRGYFRLDLGESQTSGRLS